MFNNSPIALAAFNCHELDTTLNFFNLPQITKKNKRKKHTSETSKFQFFRVPQVRVSFGDIDKRCTCETVS